jgi:predicted PolB exonuclease-like 3'-5' exonuclease
MKSETRTSQNQLDPESTELIQELINCALACEACAAACLTEQEVTSMTRCIELNKDCADICFLASRLVMRESEVQEQYLAICEEICRLCMEECQKYESEHCKICADTCERCADVCHHHLSNA